MHAHVLQINLLKFEKSRTFHSGISKKYWKLAKAEVEDMKTLNEIIADPCPFYVYWLI